MSAVSARCGPGVYWAEYRIIDAAQDWERRYGAPPKAEQWRLAGDHHPNVCTVQNHFGRWENMILAAGFEPRKNGCPRYWTQERIIEAIQGFVKKNGRPPKAREMVASAAQPCFSTVAEMFGSHSAALRAAGFDCPPAGREVFWTRDRIADAMLNHLFRTGRWPTGREWERRKELGDVRPSTNIVLARFGTWNEAKRHAGWISESEQRAKEETRRAKLDRFNAARRARRARRAPVEASPPCSSGGTHLPERGAA